MRRTDRGHDIAGPYGRQSLCCEKAHGYSDAQTNLEELDDDFGADTCPGCGRATLPSTFTTAQAVSADPNTTRSQRGVGIYNTVSL
jgi:hypothetical protein